ncbi:MAG: hypothetical protein IJQ73_15305 [Kiritimatiellae bacterium]|nr:hypothetical protein [Kiritimatiellia bacterium]
MNKIPLILSCSLAATVQAAEHVTYEQFGAVGDGKADDQDAIVAAHAAANERGLPVKAGDGKTYYVGHGAKVTVIMTDVDFVTASFVIDDRDVEDLRAPVFRIEPSAPAVDVEGVASLAVGQAELGVKLPAPCLVEVENANVRQYIRYGRNQNNGTPRNEVFLADANGVVDPRTPILWDYAAVTGLKAHPIDAKTLTIRGGRFRTIANQAESKYTYYNRGIAVNRSNVRIEGLRHDIEGEGDHGAPYTGFIAISLCANVTVTGCTFVPGNGRPITGALVYGQSTDSHDFGYECFMPRRIVFDCLKIDDSRHPQNYGGPNIFAMFNRDNTGPQHVEKFPYHVTEEVVLRNVTTASGLEPVLSPNKYMFRNVKVVRE